MGLPTDYSPAPLPKQGLWWRIIVSIAGLAVLAAIFSMYPTEHGNTWYHQLNQPFFAPAYWMPFVAWPLVYILMGSALGIMWQRHAKSPDPMERMYAKNGIVLFGIHLIFNLIFPFLLIGLQMPILSLVDICVLICFIFILVRFFKHVDHTASRLLIPYLLWIIYAASLNAAILVLN